MLDGVVGVLKWRGEGPEALELAESTYSSRIAGLLGRELGRLEEADPAQAAAIVELLGAADAATLRRVVLAPETSYRLLWKHLNGQDEQDLWRHLTGALEVELARLPATSARAPVAASAALPAGARWSALGDAYLDGAGGEVVAQPPLAGLVVDADSPAAIHLHCGLGVGMRLRHYADPAAKQVALQKTEDAMRALDVVDPMIAGFVRRFTLVANVVMDDEGERFSSGSTNQYVGRSIFWNAHLPSVDTGLVAEALVHEAIHALLDMHQLHEPWFLSAELLPDDPVVQSPWTGSPLRLEPFLQACFVWFGLSHFWAAARRRSPFAAERVERGVAATRRGFLRGPLLPRIEAHLPNIAPELRELVRAMQEDVVRTAAGEPSPPQEAAAPTGRQLH